MTTSQEREIAATLMLISFGGVYFAAAIALLLSPALRATITVPLWILLGSGFALSGSGIILLYPLLTKKEMLKKEREKSFLP